MNFHLLRNTIVLGLYLLSASAWAATALPAKASPPATAPPSAAALSWPREVKLPGAAILIYQPQINSWTENKLDFRAALAIKPDGADNEAFGVIFATARTRVDKATRMVVLDNLQITKSDFPTLPDRGAAYSAALQKQFAQGVRRISLDRLKQSPALAGAATPAAAVLNNVPRVIVSQSPAILVPIDGTPVLKAIPNNKVFQRVINTQALILQRVVEQDYFIHVFDGWLFAKSIQGPWSVPFIPPKGLGAVAAAVNATKTVDMLDGGAGANPRPTLAAGVPTIYTSQVPAELIVFQGNPEFVPVIGTSLQWAANTTSDVLLDSASKDYFILLAGRWFRSPDLNGQWSYVASNALPPDFARIPPTSLAGAVLQAVAGTPQAQQALNENSIAQTASVPRKNGPTFTPTFDGAPRFAPISGTSMTFVTNSTVPIIRVGDAYFAVRAGVWFTAAQVGGPWSVATSVPEAIYTIPPSSPVYYVTYVRIYDVNDDIVSEGYTPGYLGTAVSPSGTVVYGTGYSYTSWIGDAWYPAPATYGVAATPVYNTQVGYTYAFAVGLGTPSWTQPYWKGAYFSPGYWGGYPCCGTAAANVYLRWNAAGSAKVRSASVNSKGPVQMTAATPGSASRGYDQTPVPASYAGRPGAGGNGGGASANAPPARTPQWQPYSLPNVYYADSSGQVYRQEGDTWQRNSGNTWSSAPGDMSSLNQEAQARSHSAEAEASFGMSNMDRFSGAPNTGWTAEDAGDGGYSRTVGGAGGIRAEYDNYWNDVQDNAVAMWWNGYNAYPGYYGWGAGYYGWGWSGRFP
ncbi:MAG TPA: hypothetical protein PLW68_03580 [Casimicrobiaceae bacterium]|nr:hypothetical protein [Casimicrobiaceae bacterium]